MFESIIKNIRSAKKIVFVTGAGISQESGIPTFRGKDGLWRNYDAMKLATIDAFYSNPKLVWEWYNERRKNIFVADAVNAAVKAAAGGPMKGYLEYCTDPIVSTDVIGNPHSSVFDALSTVVMAGEMVKVLSWYDNEWGFSQRVVDALLLMA